MSNSRNNTEPSRSARGLGLVEVLVSIVVLVVGGAIIVVLVGGNRSDQRELTCMKQMNGYAVAFANYATDFQDKLPSFTWRPGNYHSQFSDLNSSANAIDAMAAQATGLLRRRLQYDLPLADDWFPPPAYVHLVVADYLGAKLPSGPRMCPEDKPLLRWQIFATGVSPNSVGDIILPEGMSRRELASSHLPLRSSYLVTSGAFDRRQSEPELGLPSKRIRQGDRHDTFLIPEGWASRPLSPRMSMVRVPSRKAMLFHAVSRHGEPRHYADAENTQLVLFFDATSRRGGFETEEEHDEYIKALRINSKKETSDGNKGWDPTAPQLSTVTNIRFYPDRWEHPSRKADGQTIFGTYPGRLMWTRSGLTGIDFDADEPPLADSSNIGQGKAGDVHRAKF